MGPWRGLRLCVSWRPSYARRGSEKASVFRVWVTGRLYSPWKTTMTSGKDVSEFLDTLGLVKSYFSSFLREKKSFFFG